jgi:hypothetical protein
MVTASQNTTQYIGMRFTAPCAPPVANMQRSGFPKPPRLRRRARCVEHLVALDLRTTALAAVAAVLAFARDRGLIEVVVIMAALGGAVRLVLGS